MRLILIPLLPILLFFSCQEKQSSSVDKIDNKKRTNDSVGLKVHLKNYVGKTVGELLEDQEVKIYTSYYFSDEPPGKLECLDLIYPNKLTLRIFAFPLKFQPTFSETMEFNLELFKKEKISKIIIEEDSKITIIN